MSLGNIILNLFIGETICLDSVVSGVYDYYIYSLFLSHHGHLFFFEENDGVKIA